MGLAATVMAVNGRATSLHPTILHDEMTVMSRAAWMAGVVMMVSRRTMS